LPDFDALGRSGFNLHMKATVVRRYIFDRREFALSSPRMRKFSVIKSI
jgi:hypothetical protein